MMYKVKKIFIVLSLALFPFAAYAQNQISDEVIQNAAYDLKPAFCANDLKQAIQIVERCYAKVDEDPEHKNINQCVTEDIFLMSVFIIKRKQYFDKAQTDPYAGLEFAKMKNYVGRITKYPSFIMDIKRGSGMKQVGETGGGKIAKILKQDNCWNLNKLK
ncbi:hypothetical protein [Commensalibacter oyaizuii]|uniref:DUF1311 domain-containing protein n=1 Tax=Commensalibacter oyaizuii TaxID=3043873 RepID=A0ABT6Q3W4_9PROT|nr:hypothetical protein [Commensalibacter sp. TBRC 16381]MDI2091822.1 hypothetical protein [Commensalibacter sp. TBRC 16381]